MTKEIGLVSDSLMIKLSGNSNLDMADMMRLNMFTMESERIAQDINIELPKDLYIDSFCNSIVNTMGYRSLLSFCHVDSEGLRDIASAVYGVLKWLRF